MKRRSHRELKQVAQRRRLKKSVIAVVSMVIVELFVPGQFWFEGGARYVDFLSRLQLDSIT